MQTAIVALALATGCTSLVTPHHVYAPLLDHAGQVDIAVRGGPSVPGGFGASLNLAYAPIDNFEIVAGSDFVLTDETKHYAGQFGVGVFAREDVLRLEAIAGVYGGVVEGQANGFFSPGAPTSSGFYFLEGAYMLPYAQVFVGFERDRFEFAGGVRLSAFLSDVDITPIGTSPAWHEANTDYERVYIEPTVTVRIPFDWFRLDFSTGFPIAIAGEEGPAGLAPETDLMWYLAAGVGFQLDTIEQPEPEPEPYYQPAPTPVVVQPAPMPPPSYEAPPAVVPPPPSSEPAPVIVPAPSPPPRSEGAVIVPIASPPPPTETP